MPRDLPYVHINFACSLDGKIALPGGTPYKFSSFEDMVRVHKLRAESDAILVGKNTIKNDNPKLTVSEKYYKSNRIPKAVILDSRLELGRDYNIFKYDREVIIFTSVSPPRNLENNVRIVSTNGSPITIKFILEKLKQMNVEKLMVEGGKTVITNFINSNLWDVLTIYFAPVLIGEKGVGFYDGDIMRLGSPKIEKLSEGFLLTVENFN